jgi:hypothetical protein
MTAFAFLKYLKKEFHLPFSTENSIKGEPSNSEIHRWLENKAVIINNESPKPEDIIKFPITSLIFFPGGTRRTTY